MQNNNSTSEEIMVSLDKLSRELQEISSLVTKFYEEFIILKSEFYSLKYDYY